MGKAIPRQVKIRAKVLLKRYPDNFAKDFNKNKEFIKTLNLPFSKTERNLIAGFVSRLVEEQIKEAV